MVDSTDTLFWFFGAILLGYLIITFNRLISARNACANARSGIDVNLKRRHDLIPKLVDVVRGYSIHERETLTAVIQARSEAISALGTSASAGSEQALEHALSTMTARIEAYPELKADGPYIHLMKNLTEAEEQISASRRAFNAHIVIMNNLVEQFPTLIVARLTGFVTLAFFSAESAAHTAPSVRLAEAGD